MQIHGIHVNACAGPVEYEPRLFASRSRQACRQAQNVCSHATNTALCAHSPVTRTLCLRGHCCQSIVSPTHCYVSLIASVDRLSVGAPIHGVPSHAHVYCCGSMLHSIIIIQQSKRVPRHGSCPSDPPRRPHPHRQNGRVAPQATRARQH